MVRWWVPRSSNSIAPFARATTEIGTPPGPTAGVAAPATVTGGGALAGGLPPHDARRRANVSERGKLRMGGVRGWGRTYHSWASRAAVVPTDPFEPCAEIPLVGRVPGVAERTGAEQARADALALLEVAPALAVADVADALPLGGGGALRAAPVLAVDRASRRVIAGRVD